MEHSRSFGESVYLSHRPRLAIVVPIEGVSKILFDADSPEDEARLRSWLRSSGRLDYLSVALRRLLDDLDRHDNTPFDSVRLDRPENRETP